jgi:hypothetical protein
MFEQVKKNKKKKATGKAEVPSALPDVPALNAAEGQAEPPSPLAAAPDVAENPPPDADASLAATASDGMPLYRTQADSALITGDIPTTSLPSLSELPSATTAPMLMPTCGGVSTAPVASAADIASIGNVLGPSQTQETYWSSIRPSTVPPPGGGSDTVGMSVAGCGSAYELDAIGDSAAMTPLQAENYGAEAETSVCV